METHVSEEQEEQHYQQLLEERRLETERNLALVIEGYMNLVEAQPDCVSLKLLERKLIDAGVLEQVRAEVYHIRPMKEALLKLVDSLEKQNINPSTKAALAQVRTAISLYPRETYVCCETSHNLAGRIQKRLQIQSVQVTHLI